MMSVVMFMMMFMMMLMMMLVCHSVSFFLDAETISEALSCDDEGGIFTYFLPHSCDVHIDGSIADDSILGPSLDNELLA